jgi:hypothetical protein
VARIAGPTEGDRAHVSQAEIRDHATRLAVVTVPVLFTHHFRQRDKEPGAAPPASAG